MTCVYVQSDKKEEVRIKNGTGAMTTATYEAFIELKHENST